MSDPKRDVQWTVKYWQWIYSLPKGENPLETGNSSRQKHKYQSFLCLPCTGGGEDCSRTFNIQPEDAKKDILIPVYTAACSTAELGANTNDEKLLSLVRDEVTDPVHIEVGIDGKPLQPYYVESSFFEVDIPSNPIFDITAPPGKYRALSAGYWHKLGPLPIGRHVIRFGGTGRNGFHTKVEYVVNILE